MGYIIELGASEKIYGMIVLTYMILPDLRLLLSSVELRLREKWLQRREGVLRGRMIHYIEIRHSTSCHATL